MEKENKSTIEKKEELLNEPTIVNEERIDMSNISEISRGEQLVGITFNPSGNSEVDTVKRACAYLIDVIEKHREDSIANGTLIANREFLMDHAIGEIINAQMNVVKVITFK
jgi:hypothetical protein